MLHFCGSASFVCGAAYPLRAASYAILCATDAVAPTLQVFVFTTWENFGDIESEVLLLCMDCHSEVSFLLWRIVLRRSLYYHMNLDLTNVYYKPILRSLSAAILPKRAISRYNLVEHSKGNRDGI